MPHGEVHCVNRTGWPRAAVLGANDGIEYLQACASRRVPGALAMGLTAGIGALIGRAV